MMKTNKLHINCIGITLEYVDGYVGKEVLIGPCGPFKGVLSRVYSQKGILGCGVVINGKDAILERMYV